MSISLYHHSTLIKLVCQPSDCFNSSVILVPSVPSVGAAIYKYIGTTLVTWLNGAVKPSMCFVHMAASQ